MLERPGRRTGSWNSGGSHESPTDALRELDKCAELLEFGDMSPLLKRGTYPRTPNGETMNIRGVAFGSLTGIFLLFPLERVQSSQNTESKAMDHVKHLQDFRVIEFRRYTIKEGEREHFAEYFESYFPEAFQQIGAILFGQFFERKNPVVFTWIRGFKNTDARAVINASFYYGPLWREHTSTMNSLMVDSDNVLLLRPLSPESGIPVLPSVDPVREGKDAQGVVIAQIFAVKANSVDAFAQLAEATFARYRAAGAREAGVLVTLDAPNNFPQLPVRTDGPYLVWLGIVKDSHTLDTRFTPLVERSLQSLSATGLLRGAPELVILDPTRRSRLRWPTEEQK
jgi:NIPSNAP